MLDALVVADSYDREILQSWVDCLSWGIITNQFPYPVNSTQEEEDNANKASRTTSKDSKDILQDVIDSSSTGNKHPKTNSIDPEAMELKNQKEQTNFQNISQEE